MFLFGGGANMQCKKKKMKPEGWGNQGWGNNFGW